MEIKFETNNNALLIYMCGELDEYSANFVRNQLDYILSNYSYNQIVFDMTDLDFMDSTGIGVLIGRYKKIRGANIPIYIKNTNSHVEKIFKMSGIYEIMPKIS